MIFIPVLSWREGADDQKAKNELYRAKLEILKWNHIFRSGYIYVIEYIKSIVR